MCILTIFKVWFICKRVMLPLKIKNLQFAGYAKSGSFLIGWTVASLGAVTLGASMSAHAIASFAQAMVASSYSEGDLSRVKEVTFLVLKDAEVLAIARSGILVIRWQVLLGLPFLRFVRITTISSKLVSALLAKTVRTYQR
ncbi:hypothetical protein MKX03_018339 [Papaver bracteatum]|nr:hypothetical protein MKX03_018339 [Papaver bracteatum]